ncbi:hypothetical protein ACTFIY_006857 [Dictyostelium cf. discoideum]
MATAIESIRCTNNLVDMDHHNKKPTFTRHIDNNNNSTRTIISDHNFLSTSVIIENNQQSNWRRWRLKNSSILSNYQKGIVEEYLNFYTNLYNAKIDDPMIHQELLSNWPVQRDEKWNKLDEDFSATEILDVIEQLNPNKSPNSDGITNLFYITDKKDLLLFQRKTYFNSSKDYQQ